MSLEFPKIGQGNTSLINVYDACSRVRRINPTVYLEPLQQCKRILNQQWRLVGLRSGCAAKSHHIMKTTISSTILYRNALCALS